MSARGKNESSAVAEWVARAEGGEVYEYHRGVLWKGGEEAGELARRWFEDGYVELVQKRHGPGDFSYLMIKRAECRRPPGMEERGSWWDFGE